jgi:hypothetical protein
MTKIKCKRCGATATARPIHPNGALISYDEAFFQHCHEIKELLADGGTWDQNRDCPNMSEAIRTQA